MRTSNRTPSIVPKSHDQKVYIVLDDFGRLGRSYRETDERADLEAVIMDMLERQYANPVRIVGFNTAEKWSQDVSADIAQELRRRCDLRLRDVPSSIQDLLQLIADGADRSVPFTAEWLSTRPSLQQSDPTKLTNS
jgi:hypothetical protein